MICPACKYEYKFDYSLSEEEIATLPAEGDFFYLSKGKMRRESWRDKYNRSEKTDLYACPKCSTAFIDR